MIDRLYELSAETIALIVLCLVVVLALSIYFGYKFIKRFKQEHFVQKWKLLQKKLPEKTSWREAVIEADNLLDEAMKKKKVKGNTMGERLVNARKMFSDNDAVWYGHKLRKKLEHDPNYKLKKTEVKKALIGLRTGLKDIGAM